MPHRVSESLVETDLLDALRALGYATCAGQDLQREDLSQPLLLPRLREAIDRLNPNLPRAARQEALSTLLRVEAPTLLAQNRRQHRHLVDGITVTLNDKGRTRGAVVRLVDWEHPADNDWLAVQQFTVIERSRPGEPARRRRADVVLFLNGLPIALFELKNPVDENATLAGALAQVQTYKREIPSLFRHNELLVISDGIEARVGSLSASDEWFLPWRTIDGMKEQTYWPQLTVMARGLFAPARLLPYLRHCIVFEEDSGGRLHKIVAGYHQFHATQQAVEAVVEASGPDGNRRGGVVWHTQGAGKSLTMVFFAGQIVLHPAMENPTLVVITDRNDLDGQLFGTFCRCRELLRQEPQQAQSRAHLRELLDRVSGGVVFTTVQKFFPDVRGASHDLLSARRNIVVIADEAHRSQYDFIDGYARFMREALPKASFIGFTGTPLELDDKSTREVFGDYISIYDIARAVRDGATVPIYYEGRLAQIGLDESESPRLDDEFEEIVETEEASEQLQYKRRWTQLEALVGSEERVEMVAQDLVTHWEARADALAGKAMLVCMSRRICVLMVQALIRLRPEWDHPADDQGAIKIVMTGSASDPEDWQPHIRNKQRRDALADRFKDPASSLRLVIVRDMWLTGFNAPCLHTMYVDKPMRGHGLMQAIARVNRVFHDKPGGLVVDYIGLADQLSRAVKTYTEAGGRGDTAIDKDKAVALFLEKQHICQTMMHGYDWSGWGQADSDPLRLLGGAADHILAQEDGKKRWLQVVGDLSKAFALAVPDPRALMLRDEVGFYQQVRTILAKPTLGESARQEDTEQAIRQLVSKAVAGEGVVDILDAAGLKRPDLSVLDDAFLADVQKMPQRNLAAELLERLLRGQVRATRKRNVVQARSFGEMLEDAITKYHNRAITTAQMIEELVELAKEMRQAQDRGEELGLNDEELAFYDALADNESAQDLMGDAVLTQIARELVAMLRREVTIDWTEREAVRARLRVQIKRLLKRRKYPPDKRDQATRTVLQQAEVLAGAWGE